MDLMGEFETKFMGYASDEEEENIETSDVETEEEDIFDDSEAVNKEVPNHYEQIEGKGPTVQDLELWKKQFPYAKIFKFVLMDEVYIVRTLNRVEYKSIVARQDLNAITREEVIMKTCCLFPQVDALAMGEGGAGVPATIAQFVMNISGFSEPEEVQRLV